MHIQVELTNHCNLKCWECPNRLMKRSREYMYGEVWQKVMEYIDDFKPETIILHKDGEPFLHPDLNKYLSMIADIHPNCKVDLYTNGLLLDPARIAFFTSLPMKICMLISFHFWSYKGDRYNYNKISETLLNCLKIAEGTNVEFILATHKIDISPMSELKIWQNRWLSISGGFDCLKAVHLNTSINPWGGLIESKNSSTFSTCPYMDGAHFFIGVTGNALPCCIDLEEEIKFGNIMVDECKEIVLLRDEFYQKLKNKNVEEELCLRCLNPGPF